MICQYVSVTCDGCLCGWDLGQDEDPATPMDRDGWVTLVGNAEPKHYCPACQAKGEASKQLQLTETE